MTDPMPPAAPTALAAEPVGSAASPPDRPSLPPGRWIRENLFPNARNSILTVFAILVALFAYRGLLNFMFSEERSWIAVRTNLRLMFTQAYPEHQYIRVWVTVGLVVVLAGLSAGIWARWGGATLKRLMGWLMSGGGLVAVGVLIREPSVLTDAAGETVRDDAGELVRESFAAAMADRWVWWAVALVLFGLGLALWLRFDDLARRTSEIPVAWLVFGLPGLLVASTWVIRYGHYAFADGEFIAEPGQLVAMSTRVPWTVIWLLLIGCFGIGRVARSRAIASSQAVPDAADDDEGAEDEATPELPRGALAKTRATVNLAWVLSPFFLYWVVMRDPEIDYAHVFSTMLPMGLAFGVAGSAVLWWLTRSDLGEVGRLAAIGLLLLAAFHWVAAFFGWYSMLQVARIAFLLLAVAGLLAPNFAGVAAQRRRLVGAWLFVVLLVFYGATVINAPSTIETPTDMFIGGFSVTLLVSVLTIMLSFPIGVLLALARTSRQPIFRVLSTVYIEVIRGVPLITLLLFFSGVLPLFLPDGMEIAELAAAILGYTLFSAAYLAENVRGGLQSIRRGQYEAADAVGLTTTQRTGFIVLPQSLRVSIPPLVGQVIATFKETSLLAIIGLFDFLRMANSVVPNQSQFLGVRREGLLFISVVYWVVAFAMSKYSQRLEQRVGLGQR
ncbi:MAG: amino acid ABC transporter permease [Acidimicrobiales bacterium]|nr:amino acid ABC transporter permease [Acidimicrobiales bacterium]MYG88217.1 amino acid ABC transporter permease [Acidimicrobiales bacterium]MYI26869.1 amino acid ABC transporter permease [Acidimicrobiales bacterium]